MSLLFSPRECLSAFQLLTLPAFQSDEVDQIHADLPYSSVTANSVILIINNVKLIHYYIHIYCQKTRSLQPIHYRSRPVLKALWSQLIMQMTLAVYIYWRTRSAYFRLFLWGKTFFSSTKILHFHGNFWFFQNCNLK